MNGSCLNERLLYYAAISCEEIEFTKLYKGIWKATFKKIYANHKKSFIIETYKNNTKLFRFENEAT